MKEGERKSERDKKRQNIKFKSPKFISESNKIDL